MVIQNTGTPFTKMRNEEEVITLILNVAKSDDRIRAVLLNGSRANPKAKKDKFQDFDIVYIVNEMNSFLSDHSWLDVFGERLIIQMPNEMNLGEADDCHDENPSFAYLMLFEDGNRIDLTLFPADKLETAFEWDSLTISLLDKDGLFKNLPTSTDKDYLIKRPSEKEFTECCNEFWWVSTYVAKGLWRDEIVYSKDMLEKYVRAMFLKIIEWYIGADTNFTVSFGKCGKNIKEYISPELYDKILSTYPDADKNNIWNSLFLMTEIFSDLAKKIATGLNFHYNSGEEQKVIIYLKWVYNDH